MAWAPMSVRLAKPRKGSIPIHVVDRERLGAGPAAAIVATPEVELPLGARIDRVAELVVGVLLEQVTDRVATDPGAAVGDRYIRPAWTIPGVGVCLDGRLGRHKHRRRGRAAQRSIVGDRDPEREADSH
jgi:hypothetical protein